MANVLTRGNVLIVDTVGLIFRGWLAIRGLEYVPNAAGDDCIITQYATQTPIANSTQRLTGTITSGTTLTDDDTGNNKLTAAAFPANALVKIDSHGGSGVNKNLFLITSAGNDDRIICSDAPWPMTNEAGVTYDIKAFVGTTFYHLLAAATEKAPVNREFSEPRLVENPAVTTIDGGTLYLYI